MRNLAPLAAILVSASLLAACGTTGLADRDRPDEFAVARNAPLVIPPDFALVPPAPGAPRANEVDASGQALQALFGGPAARSSAETGVVNQAGGNRADPGIRSQVADPDTAVVDKGAVTRDIVAAPEGDGADAKAGTPQ